MASKREGEMGPETFFAQVFEGNALKNEVKTGDMGNRGLISSYFRREKQEKI